MPTIPHTGGSAGAAKMDDAKVAARYLLDPDGFGATSEQVLAVYDTLGRCVPFPLAMSQTLGLDVAALETGYWERILECVDGP